MPVGDRDKAGLATPSAGETVTTSGTMVPSPQIESRDPGMIVVDPRMGRRAGTPEPHPLARWGSGTLARPRDVRIEIRFVRRPPKARRLPRAAVAAPIVSPVTRSHGCSQLRCVSRRSQDFPFLISNGRTNTPLFGVSTRKTLSIGCMRTECDSRRSGRHCAVRARRP